MREVGKGIDPAKAKQDEIGARRGAAAVRAEDTVENLKVQFIERYQKPKNRSWARIESIFEKEVLPKWRKRSGPSYAAYQGITVGCPTKFPIQFEPF